MMGLNSLVLNSLIQSSRGCVQITCDTSVGYDEQRVCHVARQDCTAIKLTEFKSHFCQLDFLGL